MAKVNIETSEDLTTMTITISSTYGDQLTLNEVFEGIAIATEHLADEHEIEALDA